MKVLLLFILGLFLVNTVSATYTEVFNMDAYGDGVYEHLGSYLGDQSDNTTREFIQYFQPITGDLSVNRIRWNVSGVGASGSMTNYDIIIAVFDSSSDTTPNSIVHRVDGFSDITAGEKNSTFSTITLTNGTWYGAYFLVDTDNDYTDHELIDEDGLNDYIRIYRDTDSTSSIDMQQWLGASWIAGDNVLFFALDEEDTASTTIYIDTDGSGDYDCDGVNDEVQFQYAFDNASDGYTIHVNASEYNISAEVLTSKNVTFEGDGNLTILNRTGVDYDMIRFLNTTGLIIQDIKITPYLKDGSGDPYRGMLAIDCCTNTTVRDVVILGRKIGLDYSGGAGIMVFNGSYNSSFYNVSAQDITRYGITSERHVPGNDVDTLLLYNCSANNTGLYGFKFSQPTNITIKYSYAFNNLQTGFYLYSKSGSLNNLIENCTSENNKINGIAIHAVDNVIIKNNTLINNGHTSGALYDGKGMLISSLNGVTNSNYLIENNIIYSIENDEFNYGIQIQSNTSTGTIYNTTIKNNVVNWNTYAGSFGVLINNASKINITNNIFSDINGTGIYNQSALSIVNSSYNDFWNNTDGNYYNVTQGIGDIFTNPLFYDNVTYNFHINSTNGTWNGTGWEVMTVDSPCIDTGDPRSDYSLEPSPNGSRINIGAYGNTIYASLSDTETTYNISGTVTDNNGDPLDGVTVTDNESIDSNVSYGAGIYNLTDYANGTYNLSFTLAGYNTGYLEVVISGADNSTADMQILPSSSAIIIPANSLGMFNNWTAATTFSAIAANESNDENYYFYNVTSGEWEGYVPGFSWNANNVIGRDNSVFMFVGAETNITSELITPSNTNLSIGWNQLALQGSDNETIADIKADIGVNCTDVWGFNSTSGEYTNASAYVIEVNEGFFGDINTAFLWLRVDL